jgi:hypothetical protein
MGGWNLGPAAERNLAEFMRSPPDVLTCRLSSSKLPVPPPHAFKTHNHLFF